MTESSEMLQRLVNIELKVDSLSNSIQSISPKTFRGHPDQAFGHLSYSQFGEDFIIANLFHLMGINQATYIDIGAHHPFNVSNTALLHARGSRGVNIEANPDLMPAFLEHRPQDINLNVGIGPEPGILDFYRIDTWSGRNTFSKEIAEAFTRSHPQFTINDVIKIQIVTLNEVIERYCGGIFPDFMSIDVEGLDFDILSSANFSTTRPKVICVEAISGNDIDCGPEILKLLTERGYKSHAKTIGNIILVDADFSPK